MLAYSGADSEILKLLLVEFGILGFENRNSAQKSGMPITTRACNSKFQSMVSRIHGQDCLGSSWIHPYMG